MLSNGSSIAQVALININSTTGLIAAIQHRYLGMAADRSTNTILSDHLEDLPMIEKFGSGAHLPDDQFFLSVSCEICVLRFSRSDA